MKPVFLKCSGSGMLKQRGENQKNNKRKAREEGFFMKMVTVIRGEPEGRGRGNKNPIKEWYRLAPGQLREPWQQLSQN